jgi:hypothetical protein
VQRPSSGTNKFRTDGHLRAQDTLPYVIDLWNVDDSAAVERTLARAASAQLARAIFKVAQDEHPGRRITMRRGVRIVVDTSSLALM